MTYETLELTVDEGVAHVRLARPDALNTMNEAFWREIPDVFRAIDADPAARVAVLSSSGKHFTAGLDLKWAGSMFSGERGEHGRHGEAFRRLVLRLQDAFNAIERCRKPVLAAVHGGCIGGGVDMVCACDCRYATDDAFFVVKEIDLAMVADVGTLQRLPKLIADGVARELAYTGRKMSAAEAQAVGLVNRVFSDHEALLEGVMAVAREVAKRSPLAIVGTKEMLNYTRDHTVADSLNYIATWQAGMFSTADVQAAMMAGMAKRDAEFGPLED